MFSNVSGKRRKFMQRIRLFLFSSVLLIALFGTTAFTAVSTASAHTTQSNHPQVTCSGNGCNGKDPEATGCAADAYTVQTAVLSSSFVELRFSPTCGTNWGRVLSRIGFVNLFVRVDRIDGLSYSRMSAGTLLFSQMVFAPTVKARACGRAGAGASPFGCTAFV